MGGGGGVAWLSPRRTIHFIFWRTLPFVHLCRPLLLPPTPPCPPSLSAGRLFYLPVMKSSSYRRKVILSSIYPFLCRLSVPFLFDTRTRAHPHTHARRRACAHGERSPCLLPAVSLSVETFGLKAAVIFASTPPPPGERKCQDPTDTLAEVAHAHAQVREPPRQKHTEKSSEGLLFKELL